LKRYKSKKIIFINVFIVQGKHLDDVIYVLY